MKYTNKETSCSHKLSFRYVTLTAVSDETSDGLLFEECIGFYREVERTYLIFFYFKIFCNLSTPLLRFADEDKSASVWVLLNCLARPLLQKKVIGRNRKF